MEGVSGKVLVDLKMGIPLDPLPESCELDSSVPHAPIRTPNLSEDETLLAVSNALRYFPSIYHAVLAPEFASELKRFGHIYMYRFRPSYAMYARPIWEYPARTVQGRAIQMMIQNNLDPRVAQFPHELITYGGNGGVLQNWAQYHLVMKYLSEMSDEQVLVLHSGHPVGLFPSHKDFPSMVLTNGMVVPNYSRPEDYDRMYALGVSQYGQMTAGSFCYIGPQGIVHGTTITLANAGRKYLEKSDLSGTVFVTSGLGGMSGAQGKASVIAGAVGVIAEINPAALKKRLDQGWIEEQCDSLPQLIKTVKKYRDEKRARSVGYLGNVVDLWEAFANEKDMLVDLGSDQTSLHNPFNGGYYPVGLSFAESNELMSSDPAEFKVRVHASLRRHIAAINQLAERGLKFWDYGNCFLLQASRAGADVHAADSKDLNTFRYPSYVEDIMGDIFSLGFGPFRWVCSSQRPEDVKVLDDLAASVIEKLAKNAPVRAKQQYEDNLLWIRQAGQNRLVVGSQARILYSDSTGRREIARAFNASVASGAVHGPIVISRDHHDVSGTDSPFRETSNIRDGSRFCADMAVHNFVGDAVRGATWVALHNGGGTGWGEATNGGFGFVLDGTEQAARNVDRMLFWDVNHGIARRAWARNDNAIDTIERTMAENPSLLVTVPYLCDDAIVRDACSSK